jgi:hypothetical protein
VLGSTGITPMLAAVVAMLSFCAGACAALLWAVWGSSWAQGCDEGWAMRCEWERSHGWGPQRPVTRVGTQTVRVHDRGPIR